MPREPRFRQELLPTVQVVAGEQMLRFATVPEGGEIVIGHDADGVVVGSVLVEAVRNSLDDAGKATDKTVSAVSDVVKSLAGGAARARQG